MCRREWRSYRPGYVLRSLAHTAGCVWGSEREDSHVPVPGPTKKSCASFPASSEHGQIPRLDTADSFVQGLAITRIRTWNSLRNHAESLERLSQGTFSPRGKMVQLVEVEDEHFQERQPGPEEDEGDYTDT